MRKVFFILLLKEHKKKETILSFEKKIHEENLLFLPLFFQFIQLIYSHKTVLLIQLICMIHLEMKEW